MARKHRTLSRQTEKRDEYDQWLNTAFSPWYPCMDIICFHIFFCTFVYFLAKCCYFENHRGFRGLRENRMQKKKNMIQRKNEAFLHLNIHQNESLVHFLITPWRRAHCICYYSCCFFICLYCSLSVSLNKHKAPQRNFPPPLHPRESLYIESWDHLTRSSLSAHLNSVWSVSDIGGEF